MSKLIIGQEGFSEQMLKDVQFSPENLDGAMIEQPGLFAYYAEQSRLAAKKEANLKLKLEMIESEIDKELRDEAAVSGTKITEKMIEQAISRDERYVKAKMSHNDAKATDQMLRDILEAFKQRRDMMIQVGLTRRDEMRSQSTVVRDDELKARRDALLSRGEKVTAVA